MKQVWFDLKSQFRDSNVGIDVTSPGSDGYIQVGTTQLLFSSYQTKERLISRTVPSKLRSEGDDGSNQPIFSSKMLVPSWMDRQYVYLLCLTTISTFCRAWHRERSASWHWITCTRAFRCYVTLYINFILIWSPDIMLDDASSEWHDASSYGGIREQCPTSVG